MERCQFAAFGRRREARVSSGRLNSSRDAAPAVNQSVPPASTHRTVSPPPRASVRAGEVADPAGTQLLDLALGHQGHRSLSMHQRQPGVQAVEAVGEVVHRPDIRRRAVEQGDLGRRGFRGESQSSTAPISRVISALAVQSSGLACHRCGPRRSAFMTAPDRAVTEVHPHPHPAAVSPVALVLMSHGVRPASAIK